MDAILDAWNSWVPGIIAGFKQYAFISMPGVDFFYALLIGIFYLAAPIYTFVLWRTGHRIEKKKFKEMSERAQRPWFYELILKDEHRRATTEWDSSREPIFSRFFESTERSPHFEKLKNPAFDARSYLKEYETGLFPYEWEAAWRFLSDTGLTRIFSRLTSKTFEMHHGAERQEAEHYLKNLYLDAIYLYQRESGIRPDYSVETGARLVDLKNRAYCIGMIAKEYFDLKHFTESSNAYAAQAQLFETVGSTEDAATALQNASEALEFYILRGHTWEKSNFTIKLTDRGKQLVGEKMIDYLQKASHLFRAAGAPEKASATSLKAQKLREPNSSKCRTLLWGRCLGYGERPLTILLTMLNVIVLFGLLFSVLTYVTDLHGIEVRPPGASLKIGSHSRIWSTALYFSLTTATTLGSDISSLGFSTFLASIEVLFGIFLTTMFTVSFARRML